MQLWRMCAPTVIHSALRVFLPSGNAHTMCRYACWAPAVSRQKVWHQAAGTGAHASDAAAAAHTAVRIRRRVTDASL